MHLEIATTKVIWWYRVRHLNGIGQTKEQIVGIHDWQKNLMELAKQKNEMLMIN